MHQNVINKTDTVELVAYIYDHEDQPVETADLSAVNFTVLQPDGTSTTVAGTIQGDGSGFYRWTDTAQEGLHVWTAQFEFVSGEKRTYRDEFKVIDPFEIAPTTRRTEIANEVWTKLEDCFDSEAGGPWLRDMTLAYFEPSKIEKLIDQGLLLINVWPPATNLGLDYFTIDVVDPDPALPPGSTAPDPDRYVVVQATLLATIKHLMRSYVEQPEPQGANIVWQNRRDYLQRWSAIYEIEERSFKEMISLWKRQFYNFGKGALLTHSKAGRLYGTGWRARNAQRGYGW